jgi:hypothetical protein
VNGDLILKLLETNVDDGSEFFFKTKRKISDLRRSLRPASAAICSLFRIRVYIAIVPAIIPTYVLCTHDNRNNIIFL